MSANDSATEQLHIESNDEDFEIQLIGEGKNGRAKKKGR